MARYRTKSRRKFTAGLRIVGGRPVLVTPGLKRVRRRKAQQNPVVNRMIKS